MYRTVLKNPVSPDPSISLHGIECFLLFVAKKRPILQTNKNAQSTQRIKALERL